MDGRADGRIDGWVNGMDGVGRGVRGHACRALGAAMGCSGRAELSVSSYVSSLPRDDTNQLISMYLQTRLPNATHHVHAHAHLHAHAHAHVHAHAHMCMSCHMSMCARIRMSCTVVCRPGMCTPQTLGPTVLFNVPTVAPSKFRCLPELKIS